MSTRKEHTITFFGSARTRPGTPDYKIAYEAGRSLAEAGFIVCNGGYGGTMEASARGAVDAGGKTIGIVTGSFSIKANPFIGQKIVVKTFNERLLRLIETGDAYVILKGGTGTLVELATVWEYTNKGLIKEKPIILLGDFWSGLVKTVVQQLREEGSTRAVDSVTLVSSPGECIRVLHRLLKMT